MMRKHIIRQLLRSIETQHCMWSGAAEKIVQVS